MVSADTRSLAFIELLLNIGPRMEQKPVLFPCTDFTVLNISRNRKELSRWYRFSLPDEDVVESLMDKLRFCAVAQEKGFPIPATYILYNRRDAEAAAERIPFPCILKPPIKTSRWEQNAKTKVYKIMSADELLSTYDRASRWAPLLMAQEWIVGKDDDLYSCNVYFDASSKPLVTFVAKKLRQWPPEVGTSSLGVECRNDLILQETLRVFSGMRFRGLGYLEMKRDRRTGRYFIIEPNIGRPTGRSAICEAGGVELLYTMYCDCVGFPLPTNRTQEYRGVKWIYLRRDVQSAWSYWRSGRLSLREWWRSTRGPKVYALLSWKDPMPFVKDLIKAAGRLSSLFSASFPRPESALPRGRVQESRIMTDERRGEALP